MRRGLSICALFIGLSIAATVEAQVTEVASPDGRIVASVALGPDGTPTWSVSRDGRAIIAPSPLALDLDVGGRLGAGLRADGAATTRSGREDYALLGRASRVRVDWREAETTFVESAGERPRRLVVTLRVQDDGAAIRWRVPTADLGSVGLREEVTTFALDPADRCRGLNLGRFDSSHEGEFDPVGASRFRPHNAYDAPVMCETAGGPAYALVEADLGDYPAVYFSGRGEGGPGVQTRLAPRVEEPGVVARSRVGRDLISPWRAVMIADRAGDLTESTLVTDLAPPAEGDFSWVRPGHAAWDWWNGGQVAGVAEPGMNTETFRAYIDFAAEHDFAYVMIDEGWNEGAGGGGVVRPGVDVTRAIPAMDIPGLVAYGREKGVGVILWLNWKALDAQFDAALDRYQAWGVAGLKVDFMDRDDQTMVAWYRRLLSQAAEHRLAINLHGAFHPTGMTRTWPNFLTQEGVLGAEYNKWSRRMTAGHNVSLAYTRMLVGPMDYTPGGFRNRTPETFTVKWLLPEVMTTRAHELAKFVVFESPLTAVADTPDAYRASPEDTAFIAGAPTTWDETRFIAGETGEWIVLARRKGRDWWLGALTDEAGRTVDIPLDFLGDGPFEAAIWSDGATPDQTRRETRAVRTGETLTLTLAPSGGAAARFSRR